MVDRSAHALARFDHLARVEQKILAEARADELDTHRQPAHLAERDRQDRQRVESWKRFAWMPRCDPSALAISRSIGSGDSSELGSTTIR
jgi:hypothetical protein